MHTPLYIIPLLVEQPTWGGEYIAQYKSITNQQISRKKIGQSFELAAQSFVTSQYSDRLPFAVTTATDLEHPTFFHQSSQPITLDSVIAQDPEGVLGKAAVAQMGSHMDVLIKFTQAQNNSYQVHIRPEQTHGKWQPKPESWLFLEKGKATLGIDTAHVAEYKKRCLDVDAKALELSQLVLDKKLSVEKARQQLREFINEDHPSRYVNTIYVPEGKIIDLSAGGIHHSWEMDVSVPNGNVVYEVQKDVPDTLCTLRSFDQGNMKEDGTVRPLTIEDYFAVLDTDKERNQPERYFAPPSERIDGDATVTSLFHNRFYKTSSIAFHGTYTGQETQLDGSFHHLFVRDGSVAVHIGEKQWPLRKGWSLFIPAGAGQYSLTSESSSTVLKTWV